MAYIAGKSGYFEFQDVNKQFTWRINWSETYDIALNSSIVQIDSIQVKNSLYVGNWWANALVKINDVQVAELNYYTPTHRVQQSNNGVFYTMESYGSGAPFPFASTAIAHNADGSKSINISIEANPAGKNIISIQLYRDSDGTIKEFGSSQTQSVELTKIPRAATITGAPNFTDEDNPTITFSNPAGSAVDKLEACISLTGARADIAYKEITDKTATSFTFNLTDEEREVLRQATLEGSDSRSVYFILQTTIAEETYRSPLAKTFTVINANPTVSVLMMDINEKTVALTGDSLAVIIKGYSNIGYEMSGTALKGASITDYSAVNGSTTLTTATGTFNGVNTNTFTFTATDNRGLSATKTLTPNLIDYFKPTCNAEATLELDGEATAKATCKVSGNYFNDTFGAVDNELVIEILHTGIEEWVTLTDGLIPVFDGNTYSLDFTVSGLDYTKAFTYQFRVSDKLDSATSAEDSISIYPVFDWSEEDFNFNVPINMNGNQVLRYTSANKVVLSAGGADIYLRPNGTSTDAGQLRLFTDGTATLNGVKIATVDMIYPVGAIYMSVNSTSPSTIFGGTWERIQDRFLLAAGSTYTAGKTGGEASHTLTENELPSHNHGTWQRNPNASSSPSYQSMVDTQATGDSVSGWKPSLTASTGKEMLTKSVGGGAAHNNMPPYLAVYVWKRTA